jgi:hypothetical protein
MPQQSAASAVTCWRPGSWKGVIISHQPTSFIKAGEKSSMLAIVLQIGAFGTFV